MHSTLQQSFSELIAPLTPADISALWRDRAFKLQPSGGEKHFAALLDWTKLWRLIEDAIIPPVDCRITYARRPVPQLFYEDNEKFSSQKLARLLEQGCSMIVINLHTHVPTLSATLQDAKVHGIRLVEAGAVVTTDSIGALETHYDLYDLIILQVEGSKRWRIYGPRVTKPTTPKLREPPRTPPMLDAVLRAGDMLFMPAGYWHICDNGPERSLHLGLFLKPPAEDLPAPTEVVPQERT